MQEDDSTTGTPDSSNATPDLTSETPDSTPETPETPDTPDTSEETPDTVATPDTKVHIPNSHDTSTASTGFAVNVSVEPDNDDPESGYGSGDNDPVSAKKRRPSTNRASKPKEETRRLQKGSKKQLLGYPESDGRQSQGMGTFGQSDSLPGYGGGMGNGGMGSEMGGMPVGIGGGGEPLGYREPENQNLHIPGIVSKPSNYDENAEVGRGDSDDNADTGRFAKDNEDDDVKKALSKYGGDGEQDSNYMGRGPDEQEQQQSDPTVTRAIGRPFEPDNVEERDMDNHEDSPFQQVRQESPFSIPVGSLAAQVNFANQQMSPIRPGWEGPLSRQRGGLEGESPFGRQQLEMPSNQMMQPQGGESEEEQQGMGPQQEAMNFRATTMNGGAALMGLNQQGGIKRQELGNKARKAYQKTTKQKRPSHGKKSKSSKN
eukprot:gene18015-19816_t